VSLHVSIAGGRKTMGFYAGYALSLYGRAQDRMSHVLVDEKFEKGINFYYPSKNENDFLLIEKIKPSVFLKDAQVWLAQNSICTYERCSKR
jgi:CRISPR-associated protein (TIGR02584 family)